MPDNLINIGNCMTRMTFDFFRAPIQAVKSFTPYFGSMGFGAYCGLSFFKPKQQRNHRTPPNVNLADYVNVTPGILTDLVTPSIERYPYLDEKKRAEIFEYFLEHTAEELNTATMEALLMHAINSKQFAAINAVIRHTDNLASPDLLKIISDNLSIMAYEIISLHSKNKLARPFQEAFFSNKSGVNTPRIFFDHPSLAEEAQSFIQNINTSDNSSSPRKLYFHDGNMEYNQTVVTASLRGDQLIFHPSDSWAENTFRENLIGTFSGLNSTVKP